MTVIGRDTLLLAALAGLALFAAMLALEPSAAVAVAAMPLVAGGLLLGWGILHGSRPATLLFLFCATFLMQAVFRVRDYQDKDVDFQVLIKIGVWIMVAAIALLHLRRWIGWLRNPVNLPCAFFLLWLFATALVSPNPAYSAASAFTVFACVIFCAYVFATFEPVTVFTTMLLSMMLFCASSIVVYFTLPEFGHYVYWVNEERFVSPRLAGIAGSANNMALLAAFGLVVTGLYARDLHRVSRFIVPASVLVCGGALLMTNSRAPLAMTLFILVATYTFTWRRLYAGLFLASVAILLLALILPFGQETLLKAVSRSGDIGEVTSFTGRTDIWYGVLKLAEARPWMGFGYASSVFVLPLYANEIGFITSHAHNLMLQLLLTTGWIGVILFVLSAAGVILRAIIYKDRIIFSMLAFVLLNGITESSGFTTLANVCTLAFAVAVSLPAESRIEDHEDDYSYQRRFS